MQHQSLGHKNPVSWKEREHVGKVLNSQDPVAELSKWQLGKHPLVLNPLTQTSSHSPGVSITTSTDTCQCGMGAFLLSTIREVRPERLAPNAREKVRREERGGDRRPSLQQARTWWTRPSPYLSYYAFPTGLANIQRDSRLVSL